MSQKAWTLASKLQELKHTFGKLCGCSQTRGHLIPDFFYERGINDCGVLWLMLLVILIKFYVPSVRD